VSEIHALGLLLIMVTVSGCVVAERLDKILNELRALNGWLRRDKSFDDY
jgi:hypothetical protein